MVSHGFKFQNSVFDVCNDFTMLCFNHSEIGITSVKGVGCCIIHDICKSEAVPFLESSVLDNRGYS